MPLFNPSTPIPNLSLLQIDPDPDGDWLKVGSGPWQRVRIVPLDDGTFHYALEVRLSTGDSREITSADYPDFP